MGFSRHMDGVGVHEVIIETPRHNLPMALMSKEEIERVLRAYQDRYIALKGHPLLRFITIFKNYGEAAGTSLLHPHSQLVATPVAPLKIRRKYEVAMNYYDDWGTCLYCDYFKRELDSGVRIIGQTTNLMVFHPYASATPFETWIGPKTHCSSFAFLTSSQLEELAAVLKVTLCQIYHALHDPDLNLILDTAPTEEEDNPYYDWHLHIVPRLTTQASFEMGTGMRINTALPEQTADFMRQTAPEASKVV
jgi:UDPglucose--hexose-1-phosphate uridylyltransferase